MHSEQGGGAELANVAQPCEPAPKRIVWRGDEIAKGDTGRPCSLELEHLGSLFTYSNGGINKIEQSCK